jgi:hypothetical protein
MASAATISIAATAKVIHMPTVTAEGAAAEISLASDAKASTAPSTDAPVMSPRLRERDICGQELDGASTDV